MLYQGSCHCGAVTYQVDADISSALSCNCSICSRKGYLLAFVPGANLTMLKTEVPLSSYTFNTHKIKHQFCPVCGCSLFGLGADPQGNEVAAINLRCLADLDIDSLKIDHYDGKNS
jgi:hypothetical protein